ncbi:MAG: transcriptional regulator [Anaerolineaceae bacterium]|nr:transcriptional regulator [Anaerolineaceae bacterium]
MTENILTSILGLDRVIHEPARFLLMTLLFSVEEADFTFLMKKTGLTSGNLSSHITKLENEGYVAVEKMFKGKRPLTICKLTGEGENAYRFYRLKLDEILSEMPDVTIKE